MDPAINSPGHGNNIVDGLNATDKRYLKYQMESIGKLASNDTSKIGILPNALKYVSVEFLEIYIHVLNNKDSFNGLKVSTKMQNR